MQITKTGKNNFVGYAYFELSDFIPAVNTLFKKHGLCSMVTFDVVATLTIIDSEKPGDDLVFSAPMSTAALKGAHDVQNLGAVITYLRRYLYILALEIVEHDALGATQGKDTPAKDTTDKVEKLKDKISPDPDRAEKAKIYKAATSDGITQQQIEDALQPQTLATCTEAQLRNAIEYVLSKKVA